jgi:voltage-gated potassium channel
MLLAVVVAASLLHFAEGEAQPQHYGTFPESMWWAAETMTTVGYGDVVPQTPLGKVLASIIAIIGIGMFALPTAILGSGFLEEANRRRDQQKRRKIACPHCGGEIEG